ncbi:MAG: 2-amino-4-hydroxy-6-hydroxymethyldihydropteridine diphosphokinase [Pseudomonadota bacterium]
MSKHIKILIAVGANQPHRESAPIDTLRKALRLLETDGIRIESVARWRKSPAYPAGAGPDFVNGAVSVDTRRAPEDLLARLHEIERKLGRVRRDRWAARTCDLDLIAYGERVLPDAATAAELIALGPAAGAAEAPDRLILPHPRLAERAFVLAPLSDIAPDWRHPLSGASVAEMLAALPADERDQIEVMDV